MAFWNDSEKRRKETNKGERLFFLHGKKGLPPLFVSARLSRNRFDKPFFLGGSEPA
jgi:hypothetical protein